MFRVLLGLAVAGPLLCGGLAHAQVRVGLLEMTVEGGADPVISGQLTNRLAEVLSAREGYSVIAPDDIRALLEREATLQMLGCDDDSCLAEIGGALGADLLVKGRVAKLASGFAISLSAVDPARAQAVGRASQTWGGPSIALLSLMAPMVDQLLPPKGVALVGALEVTGAESGSQILVDDQMRGTAPAGQMGQLPIGAHEVKVVKEGMLPVTRWVVIRTGEATVLPVAQEALQGKPFYSTWWFWTVTGVVVAAGATGAALALSQGSDNPGATGVNVAVNADTAFTGGR